MTNWSKHLKAIALYTLLVATVLSASVLRAQTTTLTLDNAIEIGVKNNRDVQINKLNIEKAHAAVKEAIGTALPSVSLDATYSRFFKQAVFFLPEVFFNPQGDPNKLVPMKMGGANSYEAKASASQILFNSAVFTGIGASKIYLDVSKEQTKASVAKTISDIKKAFYGAVLAKEIILVLQQSLKTGESNLEVVRALNQEGMIAEFDVMQAEVQVGNLRPQIVQAEIGYKNAKEALKLLMNIDKSKDIEVEGSLPTSEPGLDSDAVYIAEAEKNNFDLRTLALKKEVDRAMINIERSNYYPTVAAFSQYSFQGQSNTFSNFANAQIGVVGVNFSINLFNGMQTSRRVEQATVTQLQTEEQYGQLRDYTAMQIRGRLFEIDRIRTELESHDRNIALASRSLEIANVRYTEGVGSQLEIINSDNALRVARMNRLQTVYQYVTAQTELEQLIGRVEPRYFRLAGINE